MWHILKSSVGQIIADWWIYQNTPAEASKSYKILQVARWVQNFRSNWWLKVYKIYKTTVYIGNFSRLTFQELGFLNIKPAKQSDIQKDFRPLDSTSVEEENPNEKNKKYII